MSSNPSYRVAPHLSQKACWGITVAPSGELEVSQHILAYMKAWLHGEVEVHPRRLVQTDALKEEVARFEFRLDEAEREFQAARSRFKELEAPATNPPTEEELSEATAA